MFNRRFDQRVPNVTEIITWSSPFKAARTNTIIAVIGIVTYTNQRQIAEITVTRWITNKNAVRQEAIVILQLNSEARDGFMNLQSHIPLLV